jgi:hypothetical protein
MLSGFIFLGLPLALAGLPGGAARAQLVGTAPLIAPEADSPDLSGSRDQQSLKAEEQTDVNEQDYSGGSLNICRSARFASRYIDHRAWTKFQRGHDRRARGLGKRPGGRAIHADLERSSGS